MGRLNKTIFTEGTIQNALQYSFLSKSTKKYEMFNLFVFDWESDYIAITKNNVIHEAEIKITRADFLNDFKNKKDKHILLEDNISNNTTHRPIPDYFYYAVPQGLIAESEVPEYAGLIYVTNNYMTNIVKQPPKLSHDNNSMDTIQALNLTDKFYYAYQNWRNRYMTSNADELKKMIKILENNIRDYDSMLSNANNTIHDLQEQLNKHMP